MKLDNDHAPRGNSTADGRPGLSDRVRSLRLDERHGGRPRGGRGGFLPWALAAVLLMTTAVFGFKAFRAPPAPAEDATAERTPAANTPAAAPTTSTGAGEVALESRGYIVAAHQIQISPQVGGEIVWLDPNFREGAIYQKGA